MLGAIASFHAVMHITSRDLSADTVDASNILVRTALRVCGTWHGTVGGGRGARARGREEGRREGSAHPAPASLMPRLLTLCCDTPVRATAANTITTRCYLLFGRCVEVLREKWAHPPNLFIGHVNFGGSNLICILTLSCQSSCRPFAHYPPSPHLSP